jgi:transcriptional regulator with XRE-family HTH domain
MSLTHTTHDPFDGGEPIITIGDRIMIARKRNDYSQEQLAALVGVSSKTVMRWENDRNEPGPTPCLKLAQALHVTRTWLIGDTDLRSRCFVALDGGSDPAPRSYGHLRPVR